MTDRREAWYARAAGRHGKEPREPMNLHHVYTGVTIYAEMLAGDLRERGIEAIVRPSQAVHLPGMPALTSEVLVGEPDFHARREEIQECLAVTPGGGEG